MITFISSKRFIAEVLEDISLNSPDYMDRIYAWIEYGLGQMGMSKYYKFKSEVIEIDNHRGILPCDIKFIHSFWAKGSGGCGCGTSGLTNIFISDNPMVGKDLQGYPRSNARINIDGYHVHSDIRKDKFLLLYKGVPKDKEGYPEVPDNPFVFEALTFYIIYRLALKGIEHPIIKMGDALQRWEKLYPRASNDVDWMDSSEMADFTAYWNSPYLGNIVEHLYIS